LYFCGRRSLGHFTLARPSLFSEGSYMNTQQPNPRSALDARTALCCDIERHWPGASERVVGRNSVALAIDMDVFGDSDPKKMPPHLFHGAVSIDYGTAVRADVTKQDYSVCPRHWYIDATFKCIDCGLDFLFSADEQRFWYEQRRFYVDSQPTRCPACRKKERARNLAAQKPKPK
jgi:Probable zinc-ribbon domain